MTISFYTDSKEPEPSINRVMSPILNNEHRDMHHPLSSLIDQIVQNAEKRGDFDDLPGAGKPLTGLDDPLNAVLNRIMSEADAKSPVVILRQQILASQERLKSLTDETARKDEMLLLSELHTKLAIEMEAFRKYG